MLRSKGGKRAADTVDEPSTSGQKRAKREKKACKRNTENMSSDHSTNDANRRANFSNVQSYGLNRNVNILNIKPAAKKIVIKNLKSQCPL